MWLPEGGDIGGGREKRVDWNDYYYQRQIGSLRLDLPTFDNLLAVLSLSFRWWIGWRPIAGGPRSWEKP
jgi:hypothetical protein